MTVRRPVVRWHGGKFLLAPKIIAYFPAHRVYVEPFGGGGSVLLRKPRAYAEIYNDLDGEVVALFRILRSGRAADFIEALRLTPFSRDEFNAAYEPADDDFERARRLVVRSFMGFGSDGHNLKSGRTGFRAQSSRSGTTPAMDWANFPASLQQAVERLRGVVIENRDATAVMLAHDGWQTLHYVDPPYVLETRSKLGHGHYAHEMSLDDHAALLETLKGLAGIVVLSGYAHPLYEAALRGWMRVEIKAMAAGALPRTEVLWINPRGALDDLFSSGTRQLETCYGAPA